MSTLVEHYSGVALTGSPDSVLAHRLADDGAARASKGDDGRWYCVEVFDPRRAVAVVRMAGEVTPSLSDRLTTVAARVLAPDTARELANAVATALTLGDAGDTPLALDDDPPTAEDAILEAVAWRFLHPDTYPGWGIKDVESGAVVALIEALTREARVGVSPTAHEQTTEEGKPSNEHPQLPRLPPPRGLPLV